MSNVFTIRRSPQAGKSVALLGIACACTLVIGAGIALAAEPAHVAFAGVVALLALAGALVSLRGATVVAIFLLVTYSADAAPGTAGRLAASGTIVVLLISTLVHAKLDAKRIELPGDVRWIALYVGTVAIATALAELGSGSSESLIDLVGYAALAGLVCTLLDDAAWVRRGAWAIASSFGVLAVLAIAQQLLHTYDATFAGLVKVEFDGDLIRSAGPLSSNFFGQGLAAGAALAFYLALAARSARERAIAIGVVVACVVALLYTFSRGAIVAVIVAALLAAVLRRVRARTIVLVAVGTVFVALVALPPEVTERVRDLASLGSPTSREDPSVRGRTSENLAALEMWQAYPIAGVGPGNFEARYLDYSAGIGIDDRAEGRSAHSLYLEALAETGLLAGLPFFALILVTLRRPWQARSRLQGSDLLLAEGTLVALVAYLVAAATLHSAYPRYMWVFFGLALAAGRLRPVDAP